MRRAIPACVLLLALAGCSSGGTPKQVVSQGPAGTADVRTAAQKAEDTFIGTLAAHLCNVQSTVYDDTKALAAAYQSAPSYPGLDAGQVAAFQKRLTTDPAFSARLTNQLKATCHPAAEVTATP
jgi:hypothetical protein